jgi:hypothetical protein
MNVTKGGAGVSNLDLHRQNMEEAHRAHHVLRAIAAPSTKPRLRAGRLFSEPACSMAGAGQHPQPDTSPLNRDSCARVC